MEKAVQQCLVAAAHQFDTILQKKMLRVRVMQNCRLYFVKTYIIAIDNILMLRITIRHMLRLHHLGNHCCDGKMRHSSLTYVVL